MKFFVKRVLSFVLLFCLILPLFACGLIEQPDSKKEPWSNAANPPSTTEKEKTPEELIVGTWSFERECYFIDGDYLNFSASDYKAEIGEEYDANEYLMIFREDGSVWSYEDSNLETIAYWQIQGTKLLLKYVSTDWSDDPVEVSLIQLDKTSLIMRTDMGSYSEDYLQGYMDSLSSEASEVISFLSDGEYMEITYRRQND